jgi:DNA-directed RNA polymerase subunit RPC12/RpoP
MTQIYKDEDIACDYVKCPICQGRMCDKPIGEKATALKVTDDSHNESKNAKLILKCPRCTSKYLVSIGFDDI